MFIAGCSTYERVKHVPGGNNLLLCGRTRHRSRTDPRGHVTLTPKCDNSRIVEQNKTS